MSFPRPGSVTSYLNPSSISLQPICLSYPPLCSSRLDLHFALVLRLAASLPFTFRRFLFHPDRRSLPAATSYTPTPLCLRGVCHRREQSLAEPSFPQLPIQLSPIPAPRSMYFVHFIPPARTVCCLSYRVSRIHLRTFKGIISHANAPARSRRVIFLLSSVIFPPSAPCVRGAASIANPQGDVSTSPRAATPRTGWIEHNYKLWSVPRGWSSARDGTQREARSRAANRTA